MPLTITSVSNPKIQAYRRLMKDGKPDKGNCIPIEGLKLLEEAIKSGLPVAAIYVSHPRAEDEDVQALLRLAVSADVTLVSQRVMNIMAGTESPQGITALVKLPQFHWHEILSASPLILVVHQLQDPGNLGTIIRSAEAFGTSAVVLTGHTVSLFNQKAIRASAGSIFRLPCFSRDNLDSLLTELRPYGFRVMATTSHGGKDFQDVDYRGPAALVVGNEAQGLPEEALYRIGESIHIPHAHSVESLNAAVAASIILAQAARQRRR